MAGQRPPCVAERHSDAGHVQKIQRAGNAFVQLFKSFQASLGQRLGLIPRQHIKPVLFRLQLFGPLLRELDAFQLFSRPLAKSDDVFHRVAVLALELVDPIDTLFDLVQFCIICIISIEPVDEVGG